MKSKISSEELSNLIRCSALKMTSKGKSSHIGSILSCADILAVLYADIINLRQNDSEQEKDHFILSKGHAAAGLYACLSHLNLIDKDLLETHYQDGSVLSGHVSHKFSENIEVSTGALGHGLPISCGIALRSKIRGNLSRTFCLMSDGELDEGSNWEAFLFANHHNLNNLTIIIDRNNLQSITTTEKTLKLEPLNEKILSFGLKVIYCDGHDHKELFKAFDLHSDLPTVIIANTIKGKGVSFMENSVLWHYRSPSYEEVNKAFNELS